MHTQYLLYTVAPGDTLFDLALKFNVPVKEISRINGLADPNVLTPGQKLYIPVSDAFLSVALLLCRSAGVACPVVDTLPQAPAEDGCTQDGRCFHRHQIRRGDTVYLLARQFGTTPAAILSLNPQITDVRNLKPGTWLTIPVASTGAELYVVRPGDSLYKIAREKGVTVEALAEENFLGDDTAIYPGQQLLIPQK